VELGQHERRRRIGQQQPGALEQPAGGATFEDRDEFDLPRTKELLSRHAAPGQSAGASGDVVATLFDAVIEHAGTDHLADDATVVLVEV
ncbi:MAG: hypothetical protein AAGK78_10540, partial [Planctomycetota bacterium]